MNFQDKAQEALKREVTPIQGARRVLQKLMRAEVPFCVASNGVVAKMHVTLEQTGMLPRFKGNMFSAYEVGLSKPAPDIFLHAADANGIRLEHCLVVQDSASGFEAAAHAGMGCFAYIPKGTKPVTNLFGARQFSDMGLLPIMLGLA
jgi:HAD superfamily hydrolase (TIGR01509 family)